MEQIHRYAGFLKSKLLWKDQSPDGLDAFELVAPENPKNPIQLQIPENEVLGKRIEHYFEWYLQHTDRYRLIAKNLQIFRDKITIGELDFLLKDLGKKQILHLELVYKFYLYDPCSNTTEMGHWIGPNRKDSLVEKIKKLREKQLPILFTEESSKLLKEIGFTPHNMQQKVAYFGHLFVPKELKKKRFTYINNECIIGFWIPEKSFTKSEYGKSQFYIPEKKDWMVHPKYNDHWDSFEIIQKKVQFPLEQKKSPLLWMKNNEDSFERFFIVWW